MTCFKGGGHGENNLRVGEVFESMKTINALFSKRKRSARSGKGGCFGKKLAVGARV